MARILLVDNAKEQRRALAQALQENGHDVNEAEDGKDALENLRQRTYDLVITEILLTELDGTAVINYLEDIAVKPKIIAFTGGNEQIPAEQALLLVKHQANITLPLPLDIPSVVEQANRLLNAPAVA